MFKINEKEYGMFYSVWAHCEYNDWIVTHQGASYVSAYLQKAIIMNAAYRRVHDGEKLKIEDLLDLPESDFEALLEEITKQEEADSKRTVEAETEEGNAESSAQ